MEKLDAKELISSSLIARRGYMEVVTAHGIYLGKCFNSLGEIKWEDNIDNVVTDVGANLMLDTFLGGSQNTTYYLGLISSVSYTVAPAVGNTMASHSGWYEAGTATYLPTWSTPASNARVAVTWSAASSRIKALSATANFTFSAAGTIKGCFLVTGSAAVATQGNTSGVLYSAGVFSSDRGVESGDTLQITYSTSV